jgi:hypothetical protein
VGWSTGTAHTQEVLVKINEQVRAMSPPRYTRAQAAEIVGRSVDTIVRWDREGICSPSDSRDFGETTVPLYTQEDIEALKDTARNMKVGRKPSTV